MATSFLEQLVDHNNWANEVVLAACATLSDEELDTRAPGEAWTLRETLFHIVSSQAGYVGILTKPLEERRPFEAPFEGFAASLRESGEALSALARASMPAEVEPLLKTSDGYRVQPWVVFVQALNHAGDHRRQLAGMLQALGKERPATDGWSHGEATGALIAPGT